MYGKAASGVALKRRDRTLERAGHLAMKCSGSSGSEWHSLQVESFGWQLMFLHRNRLASASRPSHPTKRRIMKLFIRVAWVLWSVTVQCVGLVSKLGGRSRPGDNPYTGPVMSRPGCHMHTHVHTHTHSATVAPVHNITVGHRPYSGRSADMACADKLAGQLNTQWEATQ